MAKSDPLPIIGWREVIALPELGLSAIPAKIDTGARTSSLHATVLEDYERDGQHLVRFAVDYHEQKVRQVCEAVQVGWRGITSSNGETQRRLVVKTLMEVGEYTFRAEISLADRSDMKFPMLIGRSALRRRFAVDSGHSWLQTPGRNPVSGHKP
ncbi:RimK/LysX family protein [Erythrobacter sp. LQ02-29]|uniref:ATP-dependent zinc protease family protein n=1 Tax=unclassified Erythrobacter TaxID=2633097 RepID=UPI001BFC7881|nr:MULTISPECIES: RimK/LysX family protein [unclassified Erythrobacter]MCP9222987.1 RimK/LysX family protein [Erythrobacter sp. LQ02-29]QWC55822.1 ATP-dependent zinc protease [Erythrobacter sp. 3-20A1M]